MKKNYRPSDRKRGEESTPNKNRASNKAKKPNDGKVRLNRFIASAGICSRREADDFIKAGLVSVNGNIVTEMGIRVSALDDVRYNGERIKSERHVYILLNKPKDFITTLKDPHASRTVMDLVGNACKERVYPVGRLDRNTTGVLLLTNDGDLTKILTHPSHNKLKTYHVTLDKNFTSDNFKKLVEGIKLDDGPIKADSLSYTEPGNKKQLGIEIHSGRNRIVRRMFEHLGYEVHKLDRVYFAGLTKKGLPRGKWRFLTDQEIAMLKMGSFK